MPDLNNYLGPGDQHDSGDLFLICKCYGSNRQTKHSHFDDAHIEKVFHASVCVVAVTTLRTLTSCKLVNSRHSYKTVNFKSKCQ